MEPGTHHDPVSESVGHAAQRAAQLISVLATAAQAYVIYRARRAAIRAAQDERASRALEQQQRLAWEEARLGWAPALDQRWLGNADVIETARAWGTALPWAEADEDAAMAIRLAEGRLRELHPYAMARYDRLRADGLAPVEAMTEAAPLFARHPHARPGDPAPPRPTLDAGRPATASAQPGAAGDEPVPGAQARPGNNADLTAGIRQGQAQADGLVRRAVVVAGGSSPAISDTGRAAARAAALAAQSFPVTAADGLKAAAGASASTAAGQQPRRQAVQPQAPRRAMVM